MRTKVPPALATLKGQLEGHQVPLAELEKLMEDLKQFGAAVTSFPPLCGRVYCQP